MCVLQHCLCAGFLWPQIKVGVCVLQHCLCAKFMWPQHVSGLFRERKLSAAGNRLCGLQGVRTPSPFAVARSRRFNPTAYVEAKRKERLEAQSSQG